MEILVHRKYKKKDYTIGRLSIDGDFICNTLEDCDRGLHDGMPDWMIRNKKIPAKTAIPTGRYVVDMDTVSPRFCNRDFYMDVCDGKLPRIKGVKGFDGILIHVGTKHEHTEGCILCGMNTVVGGLTEGKEAFKKIYSLMKEAHDRGEKIFINIG